jgi:cysteine desulfurase|tara:strand:- start:14559 stop:15716 length:1158 start_codon:yes stop_codon:yes gene_type:complete
LESASLSPIYLDYNATTPVDPRVAEVMMSCLTMDGNYGNPASRSHIYGWKAEEAVDIARSAIADLVGADSREIVFTSGATESNNLAIKGLALARQDKGKHLITTTIEHKASLDSFQYLSSLGFEVTYLPVGENGIVNPDQVKQAIRSDTTCISVMHVNNEIGTIQPIEQIGAIARNNNIAFHVDAAQSLGKLAIDVAELQVDLMSFSAHKMYGPKGIGALYVRRSPDIQIIPQMHGGGHERGMRSGTLPTHQIVGFGKACEIAKAEMAEENGRIKALRDRFWSVVSSMDGVVLNGDADKRVSGNLNIGFTGVDGETLLMSMRSLAVSSGSACTSASVEPSYVLKAIGLSDELAHSSIRFSFGRFTQEQDVDRAAEEVVKVASLLR